MSIADKLLRAKTDFDDVYEAGVRAGEAQGGGGYDQGVDDGRQAEWSDLWDAIQENGYRTSYTYGFMGGSWNDITFKPKYDMAPDWAIISMFQDSYITDLEQILNDCGVSLDTSNNGNYNSAFAYGAFTVLPSIIFGRWCSQTYETFAHCPDLETIRQITFECGDVNFTSTFNGCTSLANIEFWGTLCGSINLGDCPLTRESIESLFSVLSDAHSGKTVTLNQAAKEAAFTDEEWAELEATKPQWAFAFA